MTYLFVMSLSGSCMYLMVKFWKRVTKGKYRESIYYILLKLVILFYLTPLWFLRVYYEIGYQKLVSGLKNNTGELESIEVSSQTMYVYEDEIYFSSTIKFELLFGIVWGVVAVCVLVYQLRKYRRVRTQLLGCIGEVVPAIDRDYVLQWCKRNKILRKIMLRSCNCDGGVNFTIGIWKPIVFYDVNQSEEEKKLILKHELVHIKRCDMLWRILGVAVVCLHWINPFAWFVKKELEKVCEYSCDEEVLWHSDAQERRKYAEQIIAQSQKGNDVGFSLALSKKGNELKERLEGIVNMKNRKSLNIVGILGIVVMLVANSLTVLAYPQVDSVNLQILDESFDVEEMAWADTVFLPDGCEETGFDDVTPEILYEYQFVDMEGNIYEINPVQINANVEAYANCNHNYVTGTSQMHVKQTDGGCAVYVYESKRCSLCGEIEQIELINKITYMVCPHDI